MAATYLVDAVRWQSALRRYLGIARELRIDELDETAWDDAKRQIVDWLAEAVGKLRMGGTFEALAKPLTHVRLRTLAAKPGSAVAEPDGTHEVEASDIDIEHLFQDAGRVLTNGLHKAYWESQAERDSAEVKVELVALCRHAESMSAVEGAAERVFNALDDKHKKAISKLPEAKRKQYDRLRLATAKPADVPWSLPESIDWRRAVGETQYAAHLFVDTAGQFACKLVGWETGLLAEELVRGDVAGWLRNQPHKPWSLEIPYETGGEVRPMFPDFVVVRKVGEQFLVDILEPHDPSRDDNVDKARGLARFAERHGALFGRIQLIRKRKVAGGAQQFVRLEINRVETMQRLLLLSQASQLDALFDGVH